MKKTALDRFLELRDVSRHYEAGNNYLKTIPSDAAAQLKAKDEEIEHWKQKHFNDTMAAKKSGYEDGKQKSEARVKELEELRFTPSGDNHHNAALCPYCGEPLRKAEARIKELEQIRDRQQQCLNNYRGLIAAMHAALALRDVFMETNIGVPEAAIIKTAPDGLEEAKEIIRRLYVNTWGRDVPYWETYAPKLTAALEAVDAMLTEEEKRRK